MNKSIKKIYDCSNCGAQFPKWIGKCDECGKWGTIKEAVAEGKRAVNTDEIASELVDFSMIENKTMKRIKTGLEEFDRVLGGGIILGSLVLIGGDPGIGKSTLALEITEKAAKTGKQVLYVSAEEA